MLVKLSKMIQPNTIINVAAYNGARFDHIFLLPYLYNTFTDIFLCGSPSNIKNLNIKLFNDI